MPSEPFQTMAVQALEGTESIAEHRVETTIAPSGTVLRCIGEFDAATCEALEAALAEACRGRNTRLLLDVTRTTFIDCHALSLIITAARRLAGEDGALVLAVGRGQPRRLLELAGLGNVLDLSGEGRGAVVQAG